MEQAGGCLGLVILGGIALAILGFIMEYWVIILWVIGVVVLLAFAIGVGSDYFEKRKNKKASELAQQKIAHKESSIEYKMETLLTIANHIDESGSKRQAYLTKNQLDIRDYWNKYLD